MLLSIHIVKAAGNSFRAALMQSYGDRLMRDYGDWAGYNDPAANERREQRMLEMRARREELATNYEAIHGHFIADKYRGLFSDEQFIAFFRDPYQQTVSHYEYLKRNTKRESDVNQAVHPEVKFFNEQQPSLMDYIECPMYRNHQSQFLGSLPVEDLAFVGISEEYERSLAMFKERFSRDLGAPKFENINEQRTGDYDISPDVRAAVDKYRPRDVELYAKARELFSKQRSAAAV